MTDPRMTHTTNEAPVTVEQCDRDFTADILDFIAGLNTFPDAMLHSASCMRQGAKGEAQFRPLTDMLARHRLAALASAPAGDGVEEAVKMAIAEGVGEYIMPGAPYDAAVSKVLAALARPRAAVGEQLPADVAELVNRIGRAEWGATDALDADEHGKHVADSVRITAAYFDQTEPQRMQGLYVEGTETVICHVGTSPNSPALARALAGAWNHLCDLAALQSPPAKVEE